jgi:phage terminase large subunit
LRKTADSKVPFVRMRSASNPGNEGHEFVKIRFVDPGDPGRPFIPAWLTDNPHIDQGGYLRSLAELDPITRAQLEQGVWDEPIDEGAYYKRQYEQVEREGRICHVPHEPILPVYTFWDLGTDKARDSMTVWFVQPDGFRIRLIRSYGVGGEGMPHMAQHLSSLGYNYGEHWAPHDIEVKEVGTGKTRKETAKALGITFRTVPNIGLFEGILATRNIFSRCYFDQTNCATGLRALKNYRKDWDEKGQVWKSFPRKDWTNDYADSFRMMAVAWKERATIMDKGQNVVADYDPYTLRQ